MELIDNINTLLGDSLKESLDENSKLKIAAATKAEDPIASRVLRTESIRAKQREAERIKALLAKEKQFNKR